MLYRTLGNTQEEVSAIGLGGFHIGQQQNEQDSIQIIRSAIDRGITFMDNCWDYNEGASEIRMGQALRDGYRDRVFLMTKIDGRTKASAAQQIDESLQRLQTDRIDLMQFHEVIRLEDPDRILPRGERLRRSTRRSRPEKFAMSASQGTKIPSCICACWTLPNSTTSSLMPYKCPSM
jgi:aryl-alcohol dehydrogenase-like predicted oxidoreductase